MNTLDLSLINIGEIVQIACFKEPKASGYTHVKKHVHLLTPIVSGDTGIGSDNTCSSVLATQDFFGLKPSTYNFTAKPALNELKAYKYALENDLNLLPSCSVRDAKYSRLTQIEAYIAALEKIQSGELLRNLLESMPRYPDWLTPFFKEKTNLFSMLLCPFSLDTYLRFISPVFSVNRSQSLSYSFYGSLYTGYNVGPSNPPLSIKNLHPKDLLIETMKGKLLKSGIPTFKRIQEELKSHVSSLFGIQTDFFHTPSLHDVHQHTIEQYMGISSYSSPEEYLEGCIEGLIGQCAPDLWASVPPVSPFSVTRDNEGKRDLVVITQFFLGEVNIYCFANGLSPANFGEIFDSRNNTIGEQLAKTVTSALREGKPVERELFNFIKKNYTLFNLNRELNQADFDSIVHNFLSHWSTIKTSRHFDEFIILLEKAGEFVIHQGAICIEFGKIIQKAFPQWDNPHFQAAREEPLSHQVIDEDSDVNEVTHDELHEILTSLMSESSFSEQRLKLVTLLVSKTETNQCVFERMNFKTIQALMASTNWPLVHDTIQSHLTTLTLKTAFNHYFTPAKFLQITPEMAQDLFLAAIQRHGLDGCTPATDAASLRSLLTDKLGIDESNIASLKVNRNAFEVAFRSDSLAQVEHIIAGTKNILCTPAMFDTLHREAIRIHGEQSDKVASLSGCSQTQKLRAFLELFHISVVDISAIPTGEFIIKVNSSADRLTFNNIQQYSASTRTEQMARFTLALQKLESHANHLRETAFAGTAANAADTLVTELNHHARAYFLNDYRNNPRINYLTFKQNCLNSINSKKAVLEVYHGWDAVLANLIYVINTLIYALTLFTVNNFFASPVMKSTQEINRFKIGLDTGFYLETAPPHNANF